MAQDETCEMRALEAVCLCGQSNHTISLPEEKFPLPAYLCHCDSCRHMTGTLCLTVGFWSKQHPPPATTLQMLQQYSYGKRLTFYFCPTCGSTMLVRVLTPAGDPTDIALWGIMTGTVNKFEGNFDFQAHEHIVDTLDGGFADFLPAISGKSIPRWPRNPHQEDVLPLPWHADDVSRERQAQDVLHAHCRCQSLSFYISRPSPRSAMARAKWPDSLIPYATTTELPPETETWWLRANGRKFFASCCACTTCRLASGTEWVEFAFIPSTDLWCDIDCTKPLVLAEAPALKAFRSSEGVTRYFCATCAALAFWDGEERPEVKDVAVGLLAASEGARAEDWLEWGTGRVSFAEIGKQRAEALTTGVEEGLRDYGWRLTGAR